MRVTKGQAERRVLAPEVSSYPARFFSKPQWLFLVYLFVCACLRSVPAVTNLTSRDAAGLLETLAGELLPAAVPHRAAPAPAWSSPQHLLAHGAPAAFAEVTPHGQ